MSKTNERRAAKSPGSNNTARGRDAVRQEIISAARDLFAERGYAAVSVREIAERAGVNHGLVHRHFGAKEEVLRAVLQEMFSDVGAAAAGRMDPEATDFIKRLFPFAAARRKDWAILMRSVMDGFDFKAAGYEFPITATVVAHVEAQRGRRDRETLERSAAIIAGGIGWLLLEPYLTAVLGLSTKDKEATLSRIAAIYQELA